MCAEDMIGMGYLYGCSDNYNNNMNGRIRMAGFDMDGTLIDTMSGRTFPRDAKDWKWKYSNVPKKLNAYFEKKYHLIIVTNQAGIKNSETKLQIFKNKIEYMEAELITRYPDLQFAIYCPIYKDIHRKPYPMIFEDVKFTKLSFFCGDGAGRPDDHTDADIKFAHNIGVRFMTPENIFCNDRQMIQIDYPVKFAKTNTGYNYRPNDACELILMCGLPASGKTYWSQHIVRQYQLLGRAIERINLDTVRTKKKMTDAIQRALTGQCDILIDNTNLDKKTRKNIIDMVKLVNPAYHIVVMLLNQSFEQILHNNRYRYYTDYHNIRLIPEFVLKKMKNKMETPTHDESIDTIVQLQFKQQDEKKYMLYY